MEAWIVFSDVLFPRTLLDERSDRLKILPADDRLVVVFHVELIAFPVIRMPLELEIGEGFLEKAVPDVLLLPQYSGFDTMCAVGENRCVVGAPMGAWVKMGAPIDENG